MTTGAKEGRGEGRGRAQTFVRCGCCEAYHRTDFAGDCRNDAERFEDVPEDGIEVEEDGTVIPSVPAAPRQSTGMSTYITRTGPEDRPWCVQWRSAGMAGIAFWYFATSGEATRAAVRLHVGRQGALR